MDEVCAFCNREVPTRAHHVVPRCKGGRDIAPTCHSCEDFIHKTWTHNELRDTFNTVQKIRSDTRFRKFLRWLSKQQEEAFFRTRRNRNRTSQCIGNRRPAVESTMITPSLSSTEPPCSGARAYRACGAQGILVSEQRLYSSIG